MAGGGQDGRREQRSCSEGVVLQCFPPFCFSQDHAVRGHHKLGRPSESQRKKPHLRHAGRTRQRRVPAAAPGPLRQHARLEPPQAAAAGAPSWRPLPAPLPAVDVRSGGRAGVRRRRRHWLWRPAATAGPVCSMRPPSQPLPSCALRTCAWLCDSARAACRGTASASPIAAMSAEAKRWLCSAACAQVS